MSESTIPATDRHGQDGSSWAPSFHTWHNFLLLSWSTLCYPRQTDMTDRCNHDGPSWGFIPQHLETSWNWYWNYSLTTTTNIQDGPLWLWQSVMSFRIPTLGQTSPTYFSNHFHLTTVPPKDCPGLCRWSLLQFLLNPPCSPLEKILANKEKPISKFNTKRF